MPSHAPASTTLIGVGVGPGDPGLVTLRAVEVLRAADVVLVPVTDTGSADGGRAEQIVLAVCPEASGRLQRVPFSMAQRRGVGTKRRQSWQASAEAATAAFVGGAETVAFATVGDPSVYSTFSYLAAEVRAAVPGLVVDLVPGITAMQALAAAAKLPLVEGQESLALVPVTAGLDAVAAALDSADTVVAYKGGRHLADLLALLRERRPDAAGVMGTNVGLPGQLLQPLSEIDAESAPYFSTILVAPDRPLTGGRL